MRWLDGGDPAKIEDISEGRKHWLGMGTSQGKSEFENRSKKSEKNTGDVRITTYSWVGLGDCHVNID